MKILNSVKNLQLFLKYKLKKKHIIVIALCYIYFYYMFSFVQFYINKTKGNFNRPNFSCLICIVVVCLYIVYKNLCINNETFCQQRLSYIDWSF